MSLNVSCILYLEIALSGAIGATTHQLLLLFTKGKQWHLDTSLFKTGSSYFQTKVFLNLHHLFHFSDFFLLFWFYCHLAFLSAKKKQNSTILPTHLFDLHLLICLLNVVGCGGEFMDQLDFLFQNGKPPDFSLSQADATNHQELKINLSVFQLHF